MLVVANLLTVSILFWINANQDAQAFFTFSELVLVYTKLLVSHRLFDNLCYLIRMILEILSYIRSFMLVLIIYVFAFAIGFFQSGNAKDFPNDDGTVPSRSAFLDLSCTKYMT